MPRPAALGAAAPRPALAGLSPVCKRIARRIKELELADAAAYRARIERDPEEWPALDALSRITISRFCRDRAVFDHLGAAVLPALAEAAIARGQSELRAWSAGCASGEEPYTLALLWVFRVAPAFPELSLSVIATGADETLLGRAARACYAPGHCASCRPSGSVPPSHATTANTA